MVTIIVRPNIHVRGGAEGTALEAPIRDAPAVKEAARSRNPRACSVLS